MLKTAVLFLLLFAGSGHAFISKFLAVDTNSAEYRLLTVPETFSLKEAMLIAAGVTEENLSIYLTQISNFEAEIRPAVSARKNPIEAAYVIFSEMHKKLLKRYDESSTTLDVLLKTGKYNCLSSTALFSSLLEDFNLPYAVAILPTHAFTVLYDNGKEIDVENTTPYGFNIATNKTAQENFKKLTGFDYSVDSSIREITEKKGLIAYTYGNIAYFASKMNQDYPSFQYVLKSVAVFNQGRYVYTNVVAGYSQYIYYLTDKQRNFETALAISEEALVNLPRKEMFLSNYFYTLDRYLNTLVDDSLYAEAFQALANAKKVTGPNRVIEDNLYTRLLYRLINKENDFQKAYDYARQAVRDIPGSQNVRSLLINGLNLLEKRLVRNWETYPKDEAFFLKWYGLMKHNDFDILIENYYVEVSGKYYNAGKYDRAVEINRKGMSVLPNSMVLKKNMVYLAGNASGIYFKKDDIDNGLNFSKIALQYDPKNETVLNNIKVVYRLRAYKEIEKKKYKDAIAVVREGLRYIPGDTKLLYYLEYCNRKIKGK